MLDGMNALRERRLLRLPRGRRTLAALRQLRASGEITAADRVAIFNTAAGSSTSRPGGSAARRREQVHA